MNKDTTTVTGANGQAVELYNPNAYSPLAAAERGATRPVVDIQRDKPNPSFGKGGDPRGKAFLKPVVFILDNSADEVNDKYYVIGDPYGIFADSYPETLNAPDSGSIDPAAFNTAMATYFLDVVEMNYEIVVGDTSQFNNTFIQGYSEIDGTTSQSPMQGFFSLGQQMTTLNPELLKILWTNGEGPDVDKNFCLVIQVAAGTKVSLGLKSGTFYNK